MQQPETYVSKLVTVPGIITAASRPKHKATYVTVQCRQCKCGVGGGRRRWGAIDPRRAGRPARCDAGRGRGRQAGARHPRCRAFTWAPPRLSLETCSPRPRAPPFPPLAARYTQRLACRPGVGGVTIPRKCGAPVMPGMAASDCGLDPYVILPGRSECVDQQSLKLQERPEDVPTGDLPRSMMCLVDRCLVGSVSPGTRVSALGILSIYQSKEAGKARERAGAVALRQSYLRIVGFQEDVMNGDTARRPTFS